MDMRKHLGVALVGLMLLGAGCAGQSLPRAEEIDQSAITTYTEATTGLTFDYPSAWGEVSVSRELAGFDTGKRATISFSHGPMSLTAASADYSEGVGEGTPTYFTVRQGSGDFSTATSAAASLAQPFKIVSWERVADDAYRMTYDAQRYGGDVRMVAYLFTPWSVRGFSTLMVNGSVDPASFSEIETVVRSIH